MSARPNPDPPPDAERAPDSPPNLRRQSWTSALRATVRQFSRDQCLDLAAALTYFAVLAAAPALLALVSVLGLVSDGEEAVDRVVGTLDGVVPPDVLSVVGPLVENAAGAGGRAGIALIVGVAVALWSASGYVSAFGRAMNRIYEVDEGRPFWKLRPVLLLVTVVTVLIAAVIVAAIALSGPVARAVGDAVGLGAAAVTVWDVVKWPVVLALVVVLVAILYHVTPNVRRPRMRWMSTGAFVAIVLWVLASAAFAVYVATFSNYDATYGSLAGIIVFLLWLWITNLALLFGAELDAELERGRELRNGIPAEESLRLPPKDVRASEKREAKHRREIDRGRELREAALRE
ncbi:YihY/virulence factor BrkB family protein [Myceligenerans pegani]|uniref:YihY/virulence factor BrkB family protein n=1 Tax=Myceligenerans pegani TaxID=2776917 RepID=A0ABR9N3A8_9MICO|nr:YihY/virulence factor BrkB family protein [Myceligenerans sp. TRM 65318]MBE1877701.1 YihY/virulence factor BrkB family protein [Myceligenerans sp. TRM 65318]MBE3019972.1 YihY/virulence factor BrkB family protein [Myceligenerans sp. TRM 65318]